jgi:hypothetical protein
MTRPGHAQLVPRAQQVIGEHLCYHRNLGAVCAGKVRAAALSLLLNDHGENETLGSHEKESFYVHHGRQGTDVCRLSG